MSFATDARICGFGSSINAPPYFTTKTDPLKRFMYEIASMSTPAFSIFPKYPAALHIGLFALIEVDVSLSKVGGEN